MGVTDQDELEIRRIEAVSAVQDALVEKLGYDLHMPGPNSYEEMERLHKEGERMLASTGLERRERKLLPSMMVWDAPPVSRKSMMRKEPRLPPVSKEPLPLPPSFGGYDGDGIADGGGGISSSSAGNGEICVGRFVDTAPDEDEDEQKRELGGDESTAGGTHGHSIDDVPLGPYEHVVRCWKCRVGLKVHIEVGLVACPKCRTISPTTDIANIG